MYILMKAYENYHMMQLHASSATTTLSYEEAERFTNLMNEVFNADIKAETFITTPDDEANKAVEFYKQFERVLDGLSDLDKSSILSFCKHVYFSFEFIKLKIDGFIHYPIYIEALLRYFKDACTFEEVRESIVEYRFWEEKPKKTDSVFFRRDFLRFEKLYESIKDKKEKRLRKCFEHALY